MRLLGKFAGVEYYYTDKFLYVKKNGEMLKLELFDRHYYKLRLYNRIPVLEIDGLRMQLVRDFKSPLDYSKAVVKQLELRKSDSVLDTCMGLGYTAIEASKYASSVTTCEISQAVITLAKYNPYSKGLFGNAVTIVQGSASEKINGFKDGSFNAIIHDPPRFSHAPDLYSSAFYREMYRICKKQARLFHYVGSVGQSKGRKIEDETARRLEQAGFKNIKYEPRLQGLFFMR